MNAGNLATSARLQQVYGILSDHEPHSTWDIAQATKSCAVHSDIAALRANGVPVECRCIGRGRFVYRIAPIQERVAERQQAELFA